MQDTNTHIESIAKRPEGNITKKYVEFIESWTWLKESVLLEYLDWWMQVAQVEAISICQWLKLLAFAHDAVAVSSLPPWMPAIEKYEEGFRRKNRLTNESYLESFQMYKWCTLVHFLRWSSYMLTVSSLTCWHV